MSRALALSVIAAMLPLLGAASAPPHVSVRFDPALGPVRGRLLVFLTQTPPKGEVEPGFIHPREVEVLGTEIDAAAGSTIEMPLDAPAYPVPLRALTPGTYTARAELDVQHDYTYDGGLPGDPDSGNVSVTIASGADTTIGVGGLRKASPPRRPPLPLPRGARWEAFVSPALSAFAGRPIAMRAYVVPPAGYARSTKRYATCYVVGGYGTAFANIPQQAAYRARALAKNGGTSLFYVYLDPHVPLGHSVFADSDNNGPWGRALTSEFIPRLEGHWRMSATPATRFLTGHSSGGWTTMWLQTAYPAFFGGTWSTSPDPLDFHDFTGPDLVDDPGGNMYHDRQGRPYPFIRIKGRDVAQLSDYILQEQALGEYGGQFGSFDAAFGPRGADGRPQELFDRRTGKIDPVVAAIWDARYDIVRRVRRQWPQIGHDLAGKLHVWVGTWDTFHLDGPVHRLKALLDTLPGSDAQITFVPHRDHFDLYHGPHGGLTVTIDRAMQAAAARAQGAAGSDS
jgi:hypothetical protein